MCPEDQTLSQYFDGEIDQTQKEYIEHHVDACERCTAKIEEYTHTSLDMAEFDEPDIEQSKHHVYTALRHDPRFQEKAVFWRRRILVPAPIIVLTAAVICILFTTLFITTGVRTGNPIVLRRQHPLQLRMDEIQLDELTQFFDSQDFMIEAKMDIPETRNFSIVGEPQLLKVGESKRLK